MPSGYLFIQRSDEEVKEALKANHGLISPSAVALGVCRQTLAGRLKRNPELRRYQMECNEALIDMAVSKLAMAIENGEQWAITYFLKTQGRERGYGDTTEVNINAHLKNETINLNLSVLSLDELKTFQELNQKLIESSNLAEMEEGVDIYDSEFAEHSISVD